MQNKRWDPTYVSMRIKPKNSRKDNCHELKKEIIKVDGKKHVYCQLKNSHGTKIWSAGRSWIK